jgi:hypothetical protein
LMASSRLTHIIMASWHSHCIACHRAPYTRRDKPLCLALQLLEVAK